ncbi:hypothetical protein ACFO9Q_21945 [Paenibacillus sp. GCM10023252]|uniref:hypothetical protein n=1 Tax=Paenibacillus sp. GCM10023252 TaxID=3252649 RepID=UPI0036100720
MFDPTVFDNLKVAIENEVYDLDNLTGQIAVTNRMDRLELALMSRHFALEFKQTGLNSDVLAEVYLEASLKDLAAEILEMTGEQPGCTLQVRFYMLHPDMPARCELISRIIEEVWQPEVEPLQTISYNYGSEPKLYSNTITVNFPSRINEDQMEDLSRLIGHVVKTLGRLNSI